jgi:hypothetical protein
MTIGAAFVLLIVMWINLLGSEFCMSAPYSKPVIIHKVDELCQCINCEL